MNEFKIKQSIIDARAEQCRIILDKVYSCLSRILEEEQPDETLDYVETIDTSIGVYAGNLVIELEREDYQRIMFSIPVDGETVFYAYDVCGGEQVLGLTTSEDVILGDFSQFRQDAEQLIEVFICGNFHVFMAYLNKGTSNWRVQMERYLDVEHELPDRHNGCF